MALDVERVVDGSMARQEFLRRAGALEPLHLALPPPRRLMRILSSVVLPSPPFVSAFDPQVPGRGAVRSQVVCDQADFLHPLGYSATGRTASPTRRDNAVGNTRQRRRP